MNLQVVLIVSNLIALYYDNNGTFANSKEPRSHKRLKDIEKVFFIRDIVEQEDVILYKIASKENFLIHL